MRSKWLSLTQILRDPERNSVTLEGELDLRGFFGAAQNVRPGFLRVSGSVSFDSPASKEDLARLKAVVDAHCPVLDLFNNATPVEIRIAD
ncbi:MAG: OsmC family protein [Sulfuritalea sp.]|jgi:putative redox protein|nr:OsmC family protein [Sulfuritalea sp.]